MSLMKLVYGTIHFSVTFSSFSNLLKYFFRQYRRKVGSFVSANDPKYSTLTGTAGMKTLIKLFSSCVVCPNADLPVPGCCPGPTFHEAAPEPACLPPATTPPAPYDKSEEVG